jgi:hypothetical protein
MAVAGGVEGMAVIVCGTGWGEEALVEHALRITVQKRNARKILVITHILFISYLLSPISRFL